MKKIFSLFAAVSMALSLYAETEFTFSTSEDMNQTKDNITLSIAQGNGQTAPTVTTDYQTGKPEMRVYAGNTVTLTGTNLTNIQLVCAKSSASNKNYAEMSASTGTLVSGGEAADKDDWKVDQWTGSATQVVFTFSGSKGQRRIQRIVIAGDSIVVTPPEETWPTKEDLVPNYTYPDTTIIMPLDTTIWQKSYVILQHNIFVYCDQGSIIQATDTSVAYFNCNAAHTISFTAVQPIKGIEIDGFVRKAFSASCEPGEMSYTSDPDYDWEAYPVMVIRNINANDVEIHCDKQLRIYQARLFFKDNPSPIVGGEEGIESVQKTPKAKKIIRDGQLYILRGDQLFNALGTKL